LVNNPDYEFPLPVSRFFLPITTSRDGFLSQYFPSP
jgi:hypothetical protein